jgi:hypothetical protein
MDQEAAVLAARCRAAEDVRRKAGDRGVEVVEETPHFGPLALAARCFPRR